MATAAPIWLRQTGSGRRRPPINELKKAKQTTTDQYKTLETQEKELRREARELMNKAQAIDDAVYDLNAVNPNSVVEEDTRTPEELLDIIEQEGKEITEALAALRNM